MSARLTGVGCALCVAACGSCGSSPSGQDGGEPDPAPYAPIVWERVVIDDPMIEPGLGPAVMLPTGVAIVARPELTLWDFEGNERGRSPFPADCSGNPSVLARASGNLAHICVGQRNSLSVTEWDGNDLSEVATTAVRVGVFAAALAEQDGVLYVASTTFDGSHELDRIENGAVVETTPLSVPEPVGLGYQYWGEGVAASDGKLVFCVRKHRDDSAVPRMARIDPSSGAVEEFALSDNSFDDLVPCRLFPGTKTLLASWEGTGGSLQYGLANLDGTALIAGPMAPSEGMGLSHVAHDGSRFVSLTAPLEYWVRLVPIDDETGEILPSWQIRLQENEYLSSIGNIAIASDGSNLYVAFVARFYLSPPQLRLQKLAPLPPRRSRR